MISVLLFDFSRVIFHSKQEVTGSLGIAYDEKRGDFDSVWSMFELNQPLLDWIKDNHQTKQVVVVSASKVLREDAEVKGKVSPYFDQIIFPSEWGMSKSQPATYAKVAEDLKKEPQEIFFTDDSLINIQAAQSAGLHSHLFTSNRAFFAHASKLQMGGLL